MSAGGERARQRSDAFQRLVRGEITVDAYVADVKRRVAIALECQEAVQKHRRKKPIAFWWRRRP